jgi:glycerophosphoryl diester phosphodiesterase
MTKIIGHRGAKGLAPENTLASLGAALKNKVDEIEVDIRVTSDNIPVLFHDNQLKNKLISLYTLRELKSSKPDIITLAEAIEFVNKRVPLYLEVKPNVNIDPIVKVLRTFLANGWKESDFSLGSLSQSTLKKLHAAFPNIEKIVIEIFWGWRAALRARQLNTKRISMPRQNLWWGFIRSMHRSGYKLAIFTINDPKLASRWERHGLYAIITDYPDRFINK